MYGVVPSKSAGIKMHAYGILGSNISRQLVFSAISQATKNFENLFFWLQTFFLLSRNWVWWKSVVFSLLTENLQNTKIDQKFDFLTF